MLLAMAGAMSTGEIGLTLAEMIRKGKVHAISTTGANLEEDIFNLVAHNKYKRVPHYRDLSQEHEIALRDQGMNRVTDTCIPEQEALRRIERALMERWQAADRAGSRYFPFEYIYQLIESGCLESMYEIDQADSWVVAACQRGLTIYTPGWEDSTLGNMFAAGVVRGDLKRHDIVRSGTEQMEHLIDWYLGSSKESPVGFFQIGGGIAGDFPICVVPLIKQDLQRQCRFWGYFCQISDSTTSYGSYSGAVPNEKISWFKLEPDTPKFVIESDASIVAPLVFAYVLDS